MSNVSKVHVHTTVKFYLKVHCTFKRRLTLVTRRQTDMYIKENESRINYPKDIAVNIQDAWDKSSSIISLKSGNVGPTKPFLQP